MNKWQRQHEEYEDRGKELTLPKILTRTVFFGALIGFLVWWPWGLLPRLLICAGGVLAYMIVAYSTPLGRRI
jgi:hypothetical protein